MATDLEQETKEYKKIQRNFRLAAGVALSVLAIGCIFYHYVQHLTWVNAFYFSTTTLSTVGYGDIVPHTDVEKIFTSLYIIVGIGILATFANLLVNNAVARRQLKQLKRHSKS